MSCLHAPSLARRRPSRIPPRRIDRIQGEPDRPPLSLSHIHTSPPLFSSPTTSSSPAASLTPLHKVDQLVPICKRRGVSASRSVCVCMVLGRTPLCPTSIRRGGWGVGGGDWLFLGGIFNRTAATLAWRPQIAGIKWFIAGLFQIDKSEYVRASAYLSVYGSLSRWYRCENRLSN